MSAVANFAGDQCSLNQTGICRAASMSNYFEVCASGYWQQMALGPYICKDGQLLNQEFNSTVAKSSVSTGIYSLISQSANAPGSVPDPTGGVGSTSFAGTTNLPEPTGTSLASNSALESMENTTGNAWCRKVPLPYQDDAYGVASYRSGGKMASMYVPGGGPLRCNVPYPANNFFVAVWTRYNGDAEGSQPQPVNCGSVLSLTNPKTGKTTLAPVLDRCASCVGVGRQTSDPTTADCYVNGATVDLSQELFNYLYDEAGTGVYDIEYNGTVYGGERNGDPPDPLRNPDCALCG